MSYTEALEFSFYGAKIIHPKTMIPAVRAKIPVWIRNTFNHTCLGTKITHTISDDKRRSRSNLSSISSDEEVWIPCFFVHLTPFIAIRLSGCRSSGRAA